MENDERYLAVKDLFRLVKFGKKNWPQYSILGILSFLASLIPVGNAEALRKLFNAVFEKSSSQLVKAAIFYLIVFLFGIVVEVVRNWKSQQLSNKSITQLQIEVLRRLFLMNLINFQKLHTGDKLQRMNESVVQSQNGVNQQIPGLIEKVLSVSFLFVYLTILSWKLFIGALIIAICIPILSNMLAKPIRRLQKKINNHQSLQDSMLYDQLQAPEVTRVFNTKDRFLEKWITIVSSTNKGRIWIQLLYNSSGFIVYVGYYLGLVYIFVVGAILMSQGNIQIGSIAAFVITFEQILYPIFNLLYSWTAVQDTIAHARRIFEVVDPDVKLQEISNQTHDVSVRGDLVFENVSFSYNQINNVIQNFNLTIKEGSVTALVGSSGGGKSTILKLALGLYQTDIGTVRIGNTFINCDSIDNLTRYFAYIPQDVSILGLTVEENIRIGQIDASLEQIIHASKLARAHEFIMKLPQQYQTYLGEGGSRLSGGERQRIAIARAILRNPNVIFMDEPTASLDNQNEFELRHTIKSIMKGRTMLVVAHNLATIRDADNIVVIDHGVIIESGNHEELIKLNGRYTEILANYQNSTAGVINDES